MSHWLAFAFCLAGFTALAFATRRQQRDIFGGGLGGAATFALRVSGACALLLALYILVARHGWGMGLVMFSGHTSMAAGALYCGLVGFAGTRRRA